jgi:hypothetical protein
MHLQKIVKWSKTFITMVLLFLLTLSYLESDFKAEILQSLVVSSSLNEIAAATDATGLRHWRITYKTGKNPRCIDRRDRSGVINRVRFFLAITRYYSLLSTKIARVINSLVKSVQNPILLVLKTEANVLQESLKKACNNPKVLWHLADQTLPARIHHRCKRPH